MKYALVVRGLFLHRVDHEDRHRPLAHLELEAELAVDRVGQRQRAGRVREIRAWARGGSGAGPGSVSAASAPGVQKPNGRKGQREIVRALETGLVLNRHSNVAAGDTA